MDTVGETGICTCVRDTFVSKVYSLMPVRPALVQYKELSRGEICTEAPSFYAGEQGRRILHAHWHWLAERNGVFAFGHAAHSVRFASGNALADALPLTTERKLEEGVITQRPFMQLSTLASECIAAKLSIALASRGISTQNWTSSTPINYAKRLVLKPCAHLSSANPAVGMTVDVLLERAHLATSTHPADDSGLSPEMIEAACKAVNRNFEGCRFNKGCISFLG